MVNVIELEELLYVQADDKTPSTQTSIVSSIGVSDRGNDIIAIESVAKVSMVTLQSVAQIDIKVPPRSLTTS